MSDPFWDQLLLITGDMADALDPAVLGFLMVIALVGVALSVDGAIDAYDAWRAREPAVDEVPEEAPVLPRRMRREVTAFVKSSVGVSRYGDKRRRTPALPVPNSAEDLTYERTVSS